MQLTQATYYLLSSYDRTIDQLQDLIESVLGHSFDIVEALEMSTDAYKVVSVEPHDASQLDDYDRVRYDRWLQDSNDLYLGSVTRLILDQMCHLGHIPAGQYLIRA